MDPDNNDLSAEIAALKNQVFTLLVALIVVSGTLTVVLYRQASVTGKDVAQAEQIQKQLLTNQTNIEVFVSRLVDYGKKHPDFAQVLNKYGINPAQAPAAAPTAPVAAPAAPKK